MTESEHHFTFDLDRAVFNQISEALEASPICPLEKGAGPTQSGVYALYYIYVGKASKETTKSGRTLRQRLNEHVNKIFKATKHSHGRYDKPLFDVR